MPKFNGQCLFKIFFEKALKFDEKITAKNPVHTPWNYKKREEITEKHKDKTAKTAQLRFVCFSGECGAKREEKNSKKIIDSHKRKRRVKIGGSKIKRVTAH